MQPRAAIRTGAQCALAGHAPDDANARRGQDHVSAVVLAGRAAMGVDGHDVAAMAQTEHLVDDVGTASLVPELAGTDDVVRLKLPAARRSSAHHRRCRRSVAHLEPGPGTKWLSDCGPRESCDVMDERHRLSRLRALAAEIEQLPRSRKRRRPASRRARPCRRPRDGFSVSRASGPRGRTIATRSTRKPRGSSDRRHGWFGRTRSERVTNRFERRPRRDGD